MTDREITVTLPEALYERSVKLVEDGLFADLNELLRVGLRHKY